MDNRIREFDSTSLKSTGEWKGKFKKVSGLCVSPSGDRIYVSDAENHCIWVFDSNHQLIQKWGKKGAGAGEFSLPASITVTMNLSCDGDENVLVSDYHNCRIQVFTRDGKFVREFGRSGSGDGELNLPGGIAVGVDGIVYVADCGNHRIQVFSRAGEYLRQWGREQTEDEGSAKLINPADVALDRNSFLLVTDRGNHRVCVFTLNGKCIECWGRRSENEQDARGRFDNPQGIAISKEGRAVVVDFGTKRIQTFD